MNPKTAVRFPPSPTGFLQAGNVRTAVFNYLYARQQSGKFVVRIEDTDRERSKKEFEDNIMETLEWLGFHHDAFFRQSDQVERHKQVLKGLIEKGAAYVSKETPAEESQRSEVIRFKNPNSDVTFTDVLRGDITVNTADLGDFVIAKSMDEPLYHLGVVVDDFDEGITHVIRGEDHISNTPRQILILRAIEAPIPVYTHLPLVFGTDHKKLSKRTGAKPVLQYRDEGYLPEAVINYLALLGWHPEGEQEVFSVDELIKIFSLERIQKSSGIFDEVKLRWFNQEHLKLLSAGQLERRYSTWNGKNPEVPEAIWNVLKASCATLGEMRQRIESGEFEFLDNAPEYSQELLLKGAKADASAVKTHLEHVRDVLRDVKLFTDTSVKDAIFGYATEVGRAAVLWPMRVALSGKEKSPDPFTLAGILGAQKTIERIEKALSML
ncbi:MAG TPA: glutamate--tRNA ligase [Candidatus Paceibacterota bacterium]|nr:glutamate--tRNA ligase [Candidatus Paceibacterota bacterium]